MRHQIDPSQIARAGGFQKAGKGKGKRGIDKGFGRLFKGKLEKAGSKSKTFDSKDITRVEDSKYAVKAEMVKGEVKLHTVKQYAKDSIGFSKKALTLIDQASYYRAQFLKAVCDGESTGTKNIYAKEGVSCAKQALKAIDLANKNYQTALKIASGKGNKKSGFKWVALSFKQLQLAKAKEQLAKDIIKALEPRIQKTESKGPIDASMSVSKAKVTLAKKIAQQMAQLGS